MRYAVVNEQGEVVNAIEMEEVSSWVAPEGCSVVQDDFASIGDTYKDGNFTKKTEEQ